MSENASFAPSGACSNSTFHPRLALWAAFFRCPAANLIISVPLLSKFSSSHARSEGITEKNDSIAALLESEFFSKVSRGWICMTPRDYGKNERAARDFLPWPPSHPRLSSGRYGNPVTKASTAPAGGKAAPFKGKFGEFVYPVT